MKNNDANNSAAQNALTPTPLPQAGEGLSRANNEEQQQNPILCLQAPQPSACTKKLPSPACGTGTARPADEKGVGGEGKKHPKEKHMSKTYRPAISDRTQKQAKRLRRAMTEAEQRLWYHLRNRRLSGYKFKRQYPIGNYIADFICLEKNLIIEADGGQHNDNPRDDARTAWLQAQGYTVLRYWNHDILQQTEAVLTHILHHLENRDGK